MKKKQTIGVIITAAIIILTGIAGVVSNIVENKMLSEMKTDEATSSFASLFDELDSDVILPEEDFVGVINIVGEIGESTEESLWSTPAIGYDHDLNMEFVEEMMEADNNKGIVLYVDSPGGTVYESDELYLKLMEYKNTTGRPIWAYFAHEACSGGYYISMAADKIHANRNCTTGSIGVIWQFADTSGLYEKLGVKIYNVESDENKAVEFTEEQMAIFQALVDETYEDFVQIVCDGRDLDDATVRKLADGRIYSARQALEVDLIDDIGSYDDFLKALEEEWKLDEDVTYYDPQDAEEDPFSSLFAKVSTLVPRSEAEIISQLANNLGNGRLMYYAQ